MSIKELLEKKYGFHSFKEGQEETVEAVLHNARVLSVLPTGTGKSLCYQLPSFMLEGVTIVVSPLISLMEDQVRQLQKIGEKNVIALNSQLSFSEKMWALQNIHRYKFIFITPETLSSKEVIQSLGKLVIGLFVVDEAHCISTWGIDFRPDYERLFRVINQLEIKRVLALTATATPKVIEDIQEKLFEKRPSKLIKASVNKKNIYYQVEQIENEQEKKRWLKSFVTTYEGPGLIYCLTRKDTEMISAYLREQTNLTTAFYHGKLSMVERSNIQQQFIKDELDVLVATSAFGMGIDKPNIRYVVHYQFPASLESFVQEAGRGGRDGLQSVSVILYSPDDRRIHHYFRKGLAQEIEEFSALQMQRDLNVLGYSDIQNKWLDFAKEEKTSIQEIEQKITHRLKERINEQTAMTRFLETTECRRSVILQYFSNENIAFSPTCCDNCKQEIEGFPLGLYEENDKTPNDTLKTSQEIIKNLFNHSFFS